MPDKSEQQDTKTNESDNQLMNPAGQATNFQGYQTKDGEIVRPTKAESDNEPDTPTVDSEDDQEDKADKKADSKGDGEDKPKRRSRTQDRIDKEVARRHSAERRADLAEAHARSMETRLASLEAGRLTQPKDEPKDDPNAPKPESYEFGEMDTRFIRDTARYEAQKEYAAKTAADAKKAEDDKAAELEQERATQLEAFTAKGEELYDDFTEAVVESAKDGQWPLSPVLRDLIFASEQGPHVAYELAGDVKLARKVAKMPPAQQAAWFGKQEARLENGKGRAANESQNRSSELPEPPSRRARGAGETQPVSADTTDFAAFERLAKQGAK